MSLRIAILTVSDRASAGQMEDRGGPAIADALEPTWAIVKRAIIPDERDRIQEMLTHWCDGGEVDVIFTTGGTGLSPRDVTPESTVAVADRLIPGIGEAFRAASLAATPMAMISRGVAAVRGETLIINLPGSPNGAREGAALVSSILEHAVATLHGGKH
jgi:molybdenum cofactor synthesis domain-containing protein